MSYEEIVLYIETNIYDSVGFENLEENKQKKLMNNAINLLNKFLPNVYTNGEIPIEDIVDQMLYMLKQDDTFKRASMGMTSMSVEGGASMSFDLSKVSDFIAPELALKYDLGEGNRVRKVGSYSYNISDTYRNGTSNQRDTRYIRNRGDS